MAEPGTDGVLAGHLAAFARDAFERLASHSATARVLLHPGANAPLPPSIAAMAAPLASLLPATHDDEDAELGAELGVELGAEEDDAKDDAEGVETEEAFAHAVAASASVRDDRVARAAKVELVGALHALWSLHGEASAASGDDFDADEVFLAASSQYDADDPEELPPAHHAVWRAEQSALIPLLAAANGATLSACDRRLGAMLVEMDAAAGGGALRAMGYLWGDAAAYLARTDVALRQSTGDDRDRDPSVCVGTLAFARGDFSPAAIAAASRGRARMRGGARRRRRGSRTRASRRRRRRARLSAPTPPPSRSRSCAGGVWRRSAARFAAAPAYAYDPAWVLPFALAGLRRGSLEARDAARWGLAGVAFAASASADETTRAIAFATLDALREACDETQRPEAADFRERAQLAALLAATRNGLAPEGAADGEAVLGAAQARKRRCDDDEVLAAGLSRPTDANKDKDGSDQTSTDSGVSDIARLPTATAVFAAEAATAALHPAGDAYVITQRAVHRRAALDGEALPVNFLGALNGSGGGGGGDRAENAAIISASRGEARALRVWVLRLLLASLRRGPEDARLFRKAFAAEVLMSHRTAALSGDPYARQAALAVVARAAATPAAARAPRRGERAAGVAGGRRARRLPPHKGVGEAAGARGAAATATAALAELAEVKGRSTAAQRALPPTSLCRAGRARRARPALFAERHRPGRGRRGRARSVSRGAAPRAASARRPGAPNDAPAG